MHCQGLINYDALHKVTLVMVVLHRVKILYMVNLLLVWVYFVSPAVMIFHLIEIQKQQVT